MISLDSRTGSKELAPLFTQYGIQVRICTLPFGDLSFEGNGPGGTSVIVVERKVISDMVQSMQSRRLAGHQLPGMADAYDYCYLIVEGLWRPGDNDALELGYGSLEGQRFGGSWVTTYGRHPLLYRALDNYLATLELRAGVIYRRTLTPQETVAVIVDLYHWWRDKLWEEHTSHLGVYAPAEAKQRRGKIQLARREISLAERWAMQLPEIDAKAQKIAEHFGSARRMANASELDWLQIKGVGKVTAKAAVRLITEEI